MWGRRGGGGPFWAELTAWLSLVKGKRKWISILQRQILLNWPRGTYYRKRKEADDDDNDSDKDL